MRVYTVHQPPGLGEAGASAAERFVFVKEGFCWPALFFAPLWLIYRRMWLVLLGWLAAGVVLEGLARLAGPQSLTGALLPLGFALYFAFEANNLRRWHLAGKGFALRAVASGRDLAECEHRFFTGWAGEETAVAPRRRQATAGLAAPVSTAGDPGAVIGLFPRPGGY